MSRRKQSQPATNFYTIPAQHLRGNLAEMLVWDAVYFLLAVCGQTNRQREWFIDVRLQDIEALTGLTTKSIRQQLDKGLRLPEPFRLWEEEGEGAYTLRLKFKQLAEQSRQDKMIRKPLAFVAQLGGKTAVSTKSYEAWQQRRSWAWVLSHPYPGGLRPPRFPLAILNLLFSRPNGRLISMKELVRRSGKPTIKKPPDTAHVRAAVDHLLALGLIAEPSENQFQLVPARLQVNGEQVWRQLLDQRSEAATRLVAWATKQNPQRAKLAVEIAERGHFDIATHLKEIYHYLGERRLDTDLPLLWATAKKFQPKPPGRQRWLRFCKKFELAFKQQETTVYSDKIKLSFKQQLEHRLSLSLQAQENSIVRWGKLVLWLNDHRFQAAGVQRAAQISVTLRQQRQTVWEGMLSPENEVVRADLTASMRTAVSPNYELEIKSGRPLRQFTLAARLEAQYLAS